MSIVNHRPNGGPAEVTATRSGSDTPRAGMPSSDDGNCSGSDGVTGDGCGLLGEALDTAAVGVGVEEERTSASGVVGALDGEAVPLGVGVGAPESVEVAEDDALGDPDALTGVHA